MRRVEVWVKDKEEHRVFLTNNRKFAATTIAEIHRDRWQIEQFFESSPWCTPSDVMKFQGSIASNQPLV